MNKTKDIIIFDRESKKKCSIYPLRYREDLLFIHSDKIIKDREKDFFSDHLFLHVDGPPLSEQDGGKPLLLLDASWKRAERIGLSPLLAELPKRSLHGFTTSYPRKSKLYSMPPAGLASVEALYAAFLIQGREDMELLKHYHWQAEFLAENQEIIENLRKNLKCDTPIE